MQQRLHFIALALDTGGRQIYRQDFEIDGKRYTRGSGVSPHNEKKCLVWCANFKPGTHTGAEQALRESEARLAVCHWKVPVTESGTGTSKPIGSFSQTVGKAMLGLTSQMKSATPLEEGTHGYT